MFAKIPYPHSCEHMHCEHRQDGICILQNTRDNRGKIIGCDRSETRLMYENGKIPITNADRIRKTTDEELAKMLAYNDVFYEEICGSDERTRVCDNDCVACTLEWLRQRAKEEHHENY